MTKSLNISAAVCLLGLWIGDAVFAHDAPETTEAWFTHFKGYAAEVCLAKLPNGSWWGECHRREPVGPAKNSFVTSRRQGLLHAYVTPSDAQRVDETGDATYLADAGLSLEQSKVTLETAENTKDRAERDRAYLMQRIHENNRQLALSRKWARDRRSKVKLVEDKDAHVMRHKMPLEFTRNPTKQITSYFVRNTVSLGVISVLAREANNVETLCLFESRQFTPFAD